MPSLPDWVHYELRLACPLRVTPQPGARQRGTDSTGSLPLLRVVAGGAEAFAATSNVFPVLDLLDDALDFFDMGSELDDLTPPLQPEGLEPDIDLPGAHPGVPGVPYQERPPCQP